MKNFKVQVTSGHAAFFDTQEECGAWITEMESRERPWGNNKDRWLLETDGTHTNTRTLVSESPLDATITEYFFPKDYDYSIQDMSVEKARLDRRQKMSARLSFSSELLLDMAEFNFTKNLDILQAEAQDIMLSPVESLLRKGYLETALGKLQALEITNGLLTLEEKNELVTKVQEYLTNE